MYMSQLAYKTVAFTLILDPRPSRPENAAAIAAATATATALLRISLKSTDRLSRWLVPKPFLTIAKIRSHANAIRTRELNNAMRIRRRQVNCGVTPFHRVVCGRQRQRYAAGFYFEQG